MGGMGKRLCGLWREKGGNFAVMSAFMLVPMTLAAGGALDFVSHERTRLALQDALDRGTLAAASLTQTQEAKALIESYVNAVPEIRGAQIAVTDDHKINSRKVSASAEILIDTSFLKLAGMNSLAVHASSTALEERPNIELSLVLDISGSMYDNGGMTQLRPAAKSFLDVVLKDEVKDVTSVSIVPFAGTVNLGFDAYNLLSGYVPSDKEKKNGPSPSGKCEPDASSKYTRLHCYSSCFELVDADFNAGVPDFPKRAQVAHFSVNNISTKGKKPWWCPVDVAAVTYMTNDLTYLKQRIDALDPYDGTGTAYGMKWAELLLNPAMQPTIKSMGDSGIAAIPTVFRSRPSAFESDDTRKFIVLMTDGQIGSQTRPKLTTTDAVTDKNVKSGDARTLYTESQAAALYKKVCTYSKAQGITIFTIAFKVSDSVAKTIAECASDKSYAYKVDGLDMSSAFQSIATSMQKLRLVD